MSTRSRGCCKCRQKFTVTDKHLPRVLPCLHSACSKCVMEGLEKGCIQCGCGQETFLESLENVPVDKRTVGAIFADKRGHLQDNPAGDSVVDFVSPLMPGFKSKEVITTVPKEELVVKIGDSMEKSFTSLSKCQTALEGSTSALKRNLEKVEDHFTKIHNALELREVSIRNNLAGRKKAGQRLYDDIVNSIKKQKALLKLVGEETETNFDVVKSIEEELKKVAIYQQKTHDHCKPLHITVDNDSILQVIQSSVLIEVPTFLTPPDSEDDKSDIVSIISEASSTDTIASLLDSADVVIKDNAKEDPAKSSSTDHLKNRLASLKISKRMAETSNESIIDIDEDDQSDSSDEEGSDITLEDTSLGEENHNYSFNIVRPTLEIGTRIQVEVVKVSSPSQIWVRRSKDEIAFRHLSSDLSSKYNDFSGPVYDDWKEGQCAVVKAPNMSWVRIKILEIEDSKATVEKVDVGGDSLKVNVHDLRPLLETFTELHCLVFMVAIDDILPLGNGDNWSASAVSFLEGELGKAGQVEIEVTDIEQVPKVKMFLMSEEISEDIFSPSQVVEKRIDEMLYNSGLGTRPSTMKKMKEASSIVKEDDREVFRWKPRQLPDSPFEGTVQWLDWTCTFFVTPTPWEVDRKKVNCDIGFKLLSKSEAAKTINWRKDQACMAQYPVDGTWHRGEIVNLGNVEGKVLVRFVDFGQELEIDSRCLSKDLAAKDVPVLTIPVQLDIRPTDGEWTQATLDNIHQLVEGKNIKFETMHYGNPFPIIAKMTYDDTDLERFLVSANMARKGFRER